MRKNLKVKAFFSFLLLSVYFIMLTPLYPYKKISALTIQNAVITTTKPEKIKTNLEKYLKNIEKFLDML